MKHRAVDNIHIILHYYIIYIESESGKKVKNYIFTFTFMHLADAFIQSDLHCIQVTILHLTSSCFLWESNP